MTNTVLFCPSNRPLHYGPADASWRKCQWMAGSEVEGGHLILCSSIWRIRGWRIRTGNGIMGKRKRSYQYAKKEQRRRRWKKVIQVFWESSAVLWLWANNLQSNQSLKERYAIAFLKEQFCWSLHPPATPKSTLATP